MKLLIFVHFVNLSIVASRAYDCIASIILHQDELGIIAVMLLSTIFLLVAFFGSIYRVKIFSILLSIQIIISSLLKFITIYIHFNEQPLSVSLISVAYTLVAIFCNIYLFRSVLHEKR